MNSNKTRDEKESEMTEQESLRLQEKKRRLEAFRDRAAEAIETLCAIPTVSGFEYRATEQIRALYEKDFSSMYTDAVGNHVLIKRCGREDAKKIMVDTHLDEIGLLVSDVCEGGFLKIANLGGIDPAIMQAADVLVYGKETLRGVVISVPPHLRAGSDGKLTPVNQLMVDVGQEYTLEQLAKIVPIGTPVGFPPAYSRVGEDMLAGKSFDDKACGAIAAMAIIDTPAEELAADVYLCLSAREETSREGGVEPATYGIDPDYAMVVDVNLGSAPDVPARESVEMGGGVSVAYSAATDRELTDMTRRLLEDADIDHMLCAEPSSTGTNATSVNLVLTGVPVVDIGLPLRNMHTYNEEIRLGDCMALYDTVRAFITSCEICKRFGREVSL